jgi:5-methyltetrahydropteroyltriglutamate--homocysteine methyltransferase
MGIRTTVVGSYPKPPEEGRPFVLRKTLHALERGDATTDDLRAAQDDLVTEVVREQEEAGVDVLTDGHIRWDDILTPFARKIAGFEIGGLLRWFDNNVYYRRPVCVGPLEWRGPASVEGWQFAQSVTEKPVKAVIPGPITFARLSVDEYYYDHEAFVTAIADVLAQELFELQAAGVGIFQIDEPALLQAPEDLALARNVLESMTADLTAETILATYFGDAKRLGAELFDLPIDTVGLDFITGPENYELVGSSGNGRKLQAGVVDARNTMLEPVEELVATIEKLVEVVGANRLTVSPSCGLEFLPREKARAKLSRLSEAAGKVGGS